MASQVLTIPTDVVILGNLATRTQTIPANSIGDAQVAGLAGIQASKLQQQYDPCYHQGSTANAAADRQIVHRVKGATGVIVSMDVGAVVAGTGTASVVFDLWKNGTTILTGTVTLTASTVAFATISPGAFTSTALVAGDVLEVKVTSPSAGTGALAIGLFAPLCIREDAQ